MKIEIDLDRVQDSPDLARGSVLAVLLALPEDEVKLLVRQWEACCYTASDLDIELSQTLPPDALPDPRAHDTVGGPVESVEEWKQPAKTGAPNAGTKLEDCLSTKTANALKHAGFQVLGDLEPRSGAWLLSTVDRFGKGGLTEVEVALAAAGLALSPEAGVPRAKPTQSAPESESAKSESKPAAAPTNGSGEQETLRELCKRAEHAVGRQAVMDVLSKHGVTKLAEVGAKEPAVRAAVAALLNQQSLAL